jgi:hypothetical protein
MTWESPDLCGYTDEELYRLSSNVEYTIRTSENIENGSLLNLEERERKRYLIRAQFSCARELLKRMGPVGPEQIHTYFALKD